MTRDAFLTFTKPFTKIFPTLIFCARDNANAVHWVVNGNELELLGYSGVLMGDSLAGVAEEVGDPKSHIPYTGLMTQLPECLWREEELLRSEFSDILLFGIDSQDTKCYIIQGNTAVLAGLATRIHTLLASGHLR